MCRPPPPPSRVGAGAGPAGGGAAGVVVPAVRARLIGAKPPPLPAPGIRGAGGGGGGAGRTGPQPRSPAIPRSIASTPSTMKETCVTSFERLRWTSDHTSIPMPLVGGDGFRSVVEVGSANEAKDAKPHSQGSRPRVDPQPVAERRGGGRARPQ